MYSTDHFDNKHLCLLVWRGGNNSNLFHTSWAWNLEQKEASIEKDKVLSIDTSSSRSGSGVRGLLRGDFVSVDVRKVRFAA